MLQHLDRAGSGPTAAGSVDLTGCLTDPVTPVTAPGHRSPLERVRELARHPVARFGVVGAASTLGYLGLYAVLRMWLPAQVANVLALLATGDMNTVLNRRWSFGEQGPAPAGQRLKGVLAYLVSLVATSVALEVLVLLQAQGRVAELDALATANGVAGVVHYLLLRRWAFH